LDICTKCDGIKIEQGQWGTNKCSECGFEYSKYDLFDELLAGLPDPYNSRLDVLRQDQVRSGTNCSNIGINRNSIWEICKEYKCPLEEKCEYYCPAFLSLVGLVLRGKVTVGLPWGYDQGGDLHGYIVRWKRDKDRRL
jgi:hypothetical protein